ncbi:MAG: NADH-quinone oxidoreductase subunit NuoB [Planctomycetes bacterium]|nr:NADH-quinone oxidoreductase subunit NuoB [Planctomycetota bacterium]
MLKALAARIHQGHRTVGFPKDRPSLPDRFRGLPVLQEDKCAAGCAACEQSCPTNAITRHEGSLRLDMGRCLFCTECTQACSTGAVSLSPDYRLSASRRDDLVLTREPFALARALQEKSLRLFGHSLKLRQVSAGGCNACEADLNVLTTVVYDIGRFGIQFVASPRHADGIVVTGPVTTNMRLALEKTYAAVPAPKLVIAVGACAISGGPYAGHPEAHDGADSIVPVDLYIPGCPPHPITILDGLLRILNRLDGAP